MDRYLAAASGLGVRPDSDGLEYYPGPNSVVGADELPQGFQDGYVAIVIGGQHPGKLYPADRTAEVCRLLDRPVVLLGGPEDRERGARIAAGQEGSVYNACGAYSFNQSVSIL